MQVQSNFNRRKYDKDDGKCPIPPTKRKNKKRELSSWLVPLLSNMFDVVKSPWMRPPSCICNFPIASPICKAISSHHSSIIPCDPNSRSMSLTEGPSTYSNVKVCSTGSTEYNTGVETPSHLAFVMHLASCLNNKFTEDTDKKQHIDSLIYGIKSGRQSQSQKKNLPHLSA